MSAERWRLSRKFWSVTERLVGVGAAAGGAVGGGGAAAGVVAAAVALCCGSQRVGGAYGWLRSTYS